MGLVNLQRAFSQLESTADYIKAASQDVDNLQKAIKQQDEELVKLQMQIDKLKEELSANVSIPTVDQHESRQDEPTSGHVPETAGSPAN